MSLEHPHHLGGMNTFVQFHVHFLTCWWCTQTNLAPWPAQLSCFLKTVNSMCPWVVGRSLAVVRSHSSVSVVKSIPGYWSGKFDRELNLRTCAQPLQIYFVDLEKAFDRVACGILWEVGQKRGWGDGPKQDSWLVRWDSFTQTFVHCERITLK